MKKTILALSVLAAAVLVFSVVSPALAAGPQQGGPGNGTPLGWGRSDSSRQRGAGAGVGLNLDRNIQLDGSLEEILHQKLADALGISPEEIAAAEAEGQTLSDIAADLGYDQAAFMDLMDAARAEALAEAVDSGSLTQEQADWLATRGFGSEPGFCRGTCLTD